MAYINQNGKWLEIKNGQIVIEKPKRHNKMYKYYISMLAEASSNCKLEVCKMIYFAKIGKEFPVNF